METVYTVRTWCRESIADFAMWLIRWTNRGKDRMLSRRLHDLADTYDTRPTGEWR